jgi:hypothetical protein
MSSGVDGNYLVRGSCLCGAVTFEVTEPPMSAGYCHCTRCQKRTGTGSGVSAAVTSAAFRWTSGEDLVRGWRHPDGGNTKCFCSVCGGHLTSYNPDDRATMTVRMAAFDSDPGVRPSDRQFVAYAAGWETIPDDGLPRYQESRHEGTPR